MNSLNKEVKRERVVDINNISKYNIPFVKQEEIEREIISAIEMKTKQNSMTPVLIITGNIAKYIGELLGSDIQLVHEEVQTIMDGYPSKYEYFTNPEAKDAKVTVNLLISVLGKCVDVLKADLNRAVLHKDIFFMFKLLLFRIKSGYYLTWLLSKLHEKDLLSKEEFNGYFSRAIKGTKSYSAEDKAEIFEFLGNCCMFTDNLKTPYIKYTDMVAFEL